MLLSPKNSEAAIVDLMEKTDTKFLLHNRRFEKEANTVIVQIDGATSSLAFDVDIEKFKELDNEAQSIPFMNDSSDDETERIAFIIHSSGTTGFPKPIYLSNRYMVHLINRYANVFEPVESPKILSLAPLYHVMGVALFAIAILGGTYVFPTNVSQNLSISLVIAIYSDNLKFY
jgi:acyl-CoA synthetase (AMP-forming)/AMP-acid ligase II